MNSNPRVAKVFHDCRYYTGSSLKLFSYWATFLIALTVFCFYYYSYTLDFWWSHDDAHHLLFLKEYPITDYLLDPAIYRKFHDVHFFPWSMLIYEMNMALFDYDIQWFFVRQIIAVSLLSFSAFIFLRHWLSSSWSLFGVIVFIISPPCLIVVSQLMNGHYLEGLFFSIVASSCFVIAIRKQSIAVSIAGSMLYFMATASKEIFVPLPILLIFFPISSFRKRLPFWYPYLMISVVYYFWRSYFISDSLSTWIYDLNILELTTLPFRLIQYVFGVNVLSALAAVIIILMLFYVFIKYKKFRLLLVSASILLLVPLLPVSYANNSERYHILFAFSIVSLVVLLSADVIKNNEKFKHYIIVLNLFIGSIMIYQSFGMIEKLKKKNHSYATVGKFIFYENQEKRLYIPNQKLAAEYIRKLRKQLGHGDAPVVYYDVIQFQSKKIKEEIFQYKINTGKIKNITLHQQSIIKKWQSSIRNESISVHLNETGKGVRWKFGPYTDNRYDVLLLSRNEAFTNVRYKGIYRGKLPPMLFVVRYNSPEGWITYSDELNWSNVTDEKLFWLRNL